MSETVFQDNINTVQGQPAPVSYNFYDFNLKGLEEMVALNGEKPFRARQLFKWVYEKGVSDLSQMHDLSKPFRTQMSQVFQFDRPQVVDHKVSSDGTQKFLFKIENSGTFEAVLIPNQDRLTLCLSSEIGCNMACRFCFTGKQKLKRRLSCGEIVSQFLTVQESIFPLKVSNIVFMGMGEPLDNCDSVFSAIEVLKSDLGINLSRRKITVSTSGLVPQIPRVTEAGVHLAVSLNAPNDEVRNQIMPINRKYNLAQLMDACREHCQKSKDRVTFEYVLLKDVTDHKDHARQVYNLVKSVPCKINLIPFNEHPGSGFSRPPRSRVFDFQRYLLGKGMNVTIRRTMGRDIFAACGQLTSEYENHPVRQSVPTGTLA